MLPALVLDLETAPIEGATEFIGDDFSAPSNYKDEAKIKAYIADAKQTAVERCGLDPDLGRIVCVGWMLEQRDLEPVVIACRTEADERQALKELWREVVMPNGAHRKLVTFNGHAFDLPFLMRRSLYLGVVYPHLNIDRWRSPHIDLMARLSFNGVLKAHSLQFYAKRFSLPTDPDPVTGSDIAELVRTATNPSVGHEAQEVCWQAIEDHCASDVHATYLLASRLQLIDYDEQIDPRDQELTDAVGF